MIFRYPHPNPLPKGEGNISPLPLGEDQGEGNTCVLFYLILE
jgi:hypothetical protein